MTAATVNWRTMTAAGGNPPVYGAAGVGDGGARGRGVAPNAEIRFYVFVHYRTGLRLNNSRRLYAKIAAPTLTAGVIIAVPSHNSPLLLACSFLRLPTMLTTRETFVESTIGFPVPFTFH